MSTTSIAVELSKQQLSAARTLASEMLAPLHTPGRPQCVLFLTITEQLEAAVLLTEAGLATHAAVHVRSMLEALVDQRLLGKHERYADRMRFTLQKSEVKLHSQSLDVPELPEEQRAFYAAKLEAAQRSLADLEAKVPKPERSVPMADKFKDADLGVLLSYYTMLCSFAHNDLAALAFRHQGDEGLKLRAPDDEGLAFLVLFVAHVAVVTATQAVGEAATLPEGRFDEIRTEMVDLQYRMMAISKPLEPWKDAWKSRP